MGNEIGFDGGTRFRTDEDERWGTRLVGNEILDDIERDDRRTMGDEIGTIFERRRG